MENPIFPDNQTADNGVINMNPPPSIADELGSSKDISNNFVSTVEAETRKLRSQIVKNMTATEQEPAVTQKQRRSKRHKKSVFVCYSPDCGFPEKYFTVKLIKQLKENSYAEDIWFDHDEKIIDNVCWLSSRYERAEKCHAAILILSRSFLSSSVSLTEAKILFHRQTLSDPPRLYTVVFEPINHLLNIACTSKSLRSNFETICADCVVNLPCLSQQINSTGISALDEYVSTATGCLLQCLEPFKLMGVSSPAEEQNVGKYIDKKLCYWSTNHLQSWLAACGVGEFYRQFFAERQIDGYIMLSVDACAMEKFLGLDSSIVRRRIVSSVLQRLRVEQRDPTAWHLQLRAYKSRTDTVYLIYDPADVRLIQSIKNDLLKHGGFNVLHHQELGQSKDEFLHLNGASIVVSHQCLLILTEFSVTSPFVFQELIFSVWLGRKIVVVVFQDVWKNLRPSLKACLGQSPAVNIFSTFYVDALPSLIYALKPLASPKPGVVLEDRYIRQMAESVATMDEMFADKTESAQDKPKVFISYHWNAQAFVDTIIKFLQAHGYECITDHTNIHFNSKSITTSSANKLQSGAAYVPSSEIASSFESRVQTAIKGSIALIACVDPQYLASENSQHDLSFASQNGVITIALRLAYSRWPPEVTQGSLRRTLARIKPIDMSNNLVARKNIKQLLNQLNVIVNNIKNY